MSIGHQRQSRRQLLHVIGGGGIVFVTLGIAACAGQSPTPTSNPVKPSPNLVTSTTTGTAAGKTTITTPVAATAPALSRSYAGTKLRLMIVQHPFADALKARKVLFEKATGISVQMDIMSFTVLNQRGDLELASGSGTYDILQLIFIRSGRWIGAGWVEDLTPYVNNPKLTDKAALDLEDFVSGSLQPFQVGKSLYALPWLCDSTMIAYREDLFKKAGYANFPETYEALQQAAPKVQAVTGGKVKAYTGSGNMHWNWPNWLMSYGGNFFKNPPTDLHPEFTSKASKTTAGMFTELLAKYASAGAAGGGLEGEEVPLQIQEGNAAFYLDGLGGVQQAIDPKKSKFRDQIRFSKTPTGPAGWFPQLAVHGLMVNKASRHKEAAWQFIQWASSKEMQVWAALNYGHVANSRQSMLTNPEIVKKYTWHGDNIPQLALDVLKRAGAGYMIFRTIPQFPPIGDRVVIALTSIASGERTVDVALESLQKSSIKLLEKEGVKL